MPVVVKKTLAGLMLKSYRRTKAAHAALAATRKKRTGMAIFGPDITSVARQVTRLKVFRTKAGTVSLAGRASARRAKQRLAKQKRAEARSVRRYAVGAGAGSAAILAGEMKRRKKRR